MIAHFEDSGGVFASSQVTYRGVSVGKVDRLVLTDDGVDVVLAIENDYDEIPADSRALVGNGSAVGEQYVELQPPRATSPTSRTTPRSRRRTPRSRSRPRRCSPTSRPRSSSVDQEALQTTVDEFAKAFAGTGEDLQRIIDTGNSFIETANDNFDVTTALIRDSNTVLQRSDRLARARSATSRPSCRGFSTVLAGADPDLRRLIDTGSTSTIELRDFIETNRVELGSLFNNLVTTGEIIVRHLDGIKQVLVIYPYVVEGGFTVVSKSPDTGLYDAHFGMIITDTAPCVKGYEGTDKRPPQRRRQPADERGRPVLGAGQPEQRARRPARTAARGPRLRRSGRRLLRPRDRRVHLGRLSTRPWPRPVRWPRRRSERSRGSGCSSSP